MRLLILGADGYLGWPTALDMLDNSHEVCLADNYLRRNMAIETQSEPLFNTPDLTSRMDLFTKLTKKKARVEIIDCCDFPALQKLVSEFQPDTLIHFAEQPSAPYSMKGFQEARLTLHNNLISTFNVIWSVIKCAPKCHIIKLGTMGEYGTPNIDIEEGWLTVKHNGRTNKFLYPRQAGSLYHTTKVLDTDLIWFYVRSNGLKVTDLMQGPVYGLSTPNCDIHERLVPNFHYDDIFGTVINRFLVQAVAEIPLTIYGLGEQTRGYLNLNDTLQCIKLAADTPPEPGQLRILNQFTETFSVNQIASNIIEAGKHLGLNVTAKSIKNPRQEIEDHYYNPKSTGLKDLGLVPNLMTTEVLVKMLNRISKVKERIDIAKIFPRVKWRK